MSRVTRGMRWTAEDIEARRLKLSPARAPEPSAVIAQPKRRRGKMNGLETAYAQFLELQRLEGSISWWGFEVMKFLIADGEKQAWYTPDFPVLLPSGRLELFETKGHWRTAERLRIKVAASQHPFRFVAVQRDAGGAWVYEEFPALMRQIGE